MNLPKLEDTVIEIYIKLIDTEFLRSDLVLRLKKNTKIKLVKKSTCKKNDKI